jgi:hypothetical protein
MIEAPLFFDRKALGFCIFRENLGHRLVRDDVKNQQLSIGNVG